MDAVFPFTKFLPPQLDDRVVAGRVVERLSAAVAAHPLTVVSAPAGSGKTTALAAWAGQLAHPVAWVRLGRDDQEVAVVAAALLGGMRRAGKELGVRLGEALTTPTTAASAGHLATALVNDLGDAPGLHLVLDDFHWLDGSDAQQLFDMLVDHLPPEVRLVTASRTEPELSLARRRVRGEVAELTMRDLRLDEPAIRAVLGRDGAPDEDVVRAVARASAGWAAAVRLSAAGFVGSPPQEPDPVGAAKPDLWRFLAEEVLDSQPADLREFLLMTSVLDELTPPTCVHLTRHDDAADLLTQLERRHLFIARFSGDDGPVWRYHDLFAAFLRDRLHETYDEAAIIELHRRATEVLPVMQAVPHLLAAGEFRRVGEIAVEVALGDLDPSTLYVVLPWVNALPDEVIDQNHHLSSVLAWRDEIEGRPRAMIARLQPVYDRLLAAGDIRSAAEVGLELASAQLMLGDLDAVGPLIDAAFDVELDGLWHAVAHIVRMHWSREVGDWATSSAALEELFSVVLDSGGPRMHKTLATGLSSTMMFVDQGADWAAEQVQRLASLLEGPGTAASRAGLQPALAAVALLRLDLDTAAEEIASCLATSNEFGGLAWTHQEAEAMQLILALVAGDHAAVRAVVADARDRMSDGSLDRTLRAPYVIAAARSAFLRGDPAALDAADRMIDTVARPEEVIVAAVIKAMRAQLTGGAGGDDGLLGALEEAEAIQHQRRCWLATGLPGLERAAILFRRGEPMAAFDAFEPTLAVAAERGSGLLLPDATAHLELLRACGEAGVHSGIVGAVAAVAGRPQPRSVTIPGTEERLSARELEVLAHVARGDSNRDIAGQLFISEVTVKSHMTRILRKLDAGSRTQAVARARDLHLL